MVAIRVAYLNRLTKMTINEHLLTLAKILISKINSLEIFLVRKKVKCLGLGLDNKLEFRYHISKIAEIIGFVEFCLRKSFL